MGEMAGGKNWMRAALCSEASWSISSGIRGKRARNRKSGSEFRG